MPILQKYKFKNLYIRKLEIILDCSKLYFCTSSWHFYGQPQSIYVNDTSDQTKYYIGLKQYKVCLKQYCVFLKQTLLLSKYLDIFPL